MKNEFEKVEYGLKLLKEEYEKDVSEVNMADKFVKYAEICKSNYISYKVKNYIFLITIFILFSNLFFVLYRLNFEKRRMIANFTPEKNINNFLISKKDSIIDTNQETKNMVKKSSGKNIEKKEKNKEIFNSETLKIEDSIKFTDEINKILNLFTIKINMEEENVEI